MTEHSNFPAFVRLDYHSVYAPHVQLLHVREWLPTSITGSMGSFVAWDSTPIDAEAMIDSMVALLAHQFKSTTHYDLATIYTMADLDGQAIPRASKVLTAVGDNAVGGPDKATQATLNMRSSDNNPAKLVFLDCPVGTSNFDKQPPSSFSSVIQDIYDEISADSNAWSAKDDTQIASPISLTITLNERLRREYRQA